MSHTRAYRAKWIFPTNGEPLADATLLVEQGVIVDITLRDVPSAIDLGNVALIPGLVNAHVHLEFGQLTKPIEPFHPFTEWIRQVVALRRSVVDSVESHLQQSIDEVRRFGTVAVGEIATSPTSLRLLANSGLGGVLFHEVIGPQADSIENCLCEVQQSLETFDQTASSMQAGLSPHAPYTVHPELLTRLVQVADARDLPVAMHLAETKSELELLRSASGEFREMLERVELWPGDVWSEFRTIGDYLRLLADAPRCLVVHGNYLNADDALFLKSQSQMSVAYCPRTHANFGHPPHPWKDLIARGINVCLGTDGRSSNPDLDLWNEVKFLHRSDPEVPAATLLNLATRNGALALGLNDLVPDLAIGAPAQLTVIENLPGDVSDPFSAILSKDSRARSCPEDELIC